MSLDISHHDNQSVTKSRRSAETDLTNQLARQIQAREAGWRQAMGRLIKMHQNWVYVRCYHNLNHHQDAQDVMQDVILKMARGIHNYAWRASFRTWLATIIDNQCKMMYAQRSRNTLTRHLKELIQIHDSLRISEAEHLDIIDEVNAILDKLSSPVKEILCLRFYQDLSLEEIAGRLDISLSAAKMRLYRGLDQFKLQWEKELNKRVAA